MKLVGPIANVETIAQGPGIREIGELRKRVGDGSWKKKKGTAIIELDSGHIAPAEIHWYEAHGLGKVKLKVKRWL
jgi:hypothetical protein